MQSTTHGIETVNDNSLQDVVTRLMSDMQPFAEPSDRRASVRHVLVDPIDASVEIKSPHSSRSLPAVVRDISVDGIGLLHDEPIDLSEVVVTIFANPNKSTRIPCQIVWNASHDNGGFHSGARFLRDATVD